MQAVRVIGEVKRIWRGWERRDRIKVNDRIMVGFVRVRKQNGKQIETTSFEGKEVQGYQLVWLGKLNEREEFQSQPASEVVEIVNEPKPVKVKRQKRLTREQILDKIQAGELTTDQAVELLVKAA